MCGLLTLSACTAGAPSTRPSQRDHSEQEAVAKPRPREAPRPEGRVFRRACALDLELLRRLRRGYYPGRSPEIVAVADEPNYFGTFTSTQHSGTPDYLQEVPLVLYGPGHIRSRGRVGLEREVTLADLAPTLAELLGVRLPPRPGRPLTEVLKRSASEPPKLIVVVVWDGAGWNVLRRWPGAWPELRRLIAGGSSVSGVIVGSSPSVTPAIHSTIGTGAFPKQHGIVDLFLRDGDEVVGSWNSSSPSYLEVRSLADVYDLSTDNRAGIAMVAEKGWHLGMIGHGAALPGADRDVAVMGDAPGEGLYTNDEFYDLPGYLTEVGGYEEDVRAVDASDGSIDASWLGHSLDTPENRRLSPVFSLYQDRLLEELIEREGYGRDDVTDLVFTNYKQIDLIGHAWNMVSVEDRDAIAFSDQALGELVSFLDERVGRGKWVMAVTADHGQTPLTSSGDAWPINADELAADVEKRFGGDAGGLVQRSRPGALWLDPAALERAGGTFEEVAEMLLDYREQDNVSGAEPVPARFDRFMHEGVFATAFPYEWMPAVWRCAQQRREPSG